MSRPSDRMPVDSSLGSCPCCGEEISTGYELIRYETSSGDRRRYAECPGCRDVVHPV